MWLTFCTNCFYGFALLLGKKKVSRLTFEEVIRRVSLRKTRGSKKCRRAALFNRLWTLLFRLLLESATSCRW